MVRFKFLYLHNNKIGGNDALWLMEVEAVGHHLELYVNDEVQ